jgi:hypothetical protein
MTSAQDLRLDELKRLQNALDAATKHLDEFDDRAFKSLQKIRTRAASLKSARPVENGLAAQVAAGLAKFRQGR